MKLRSALFLSIMLGASTASAEAKTETFESLKPFQHNKKTFNYQEHIYPILKSRCFKCHGEKKQKGDFRIDNLSKDFIGNRRAAEHWKNSVNQLKIGEMPPEEAKELSDEQRRLLIEWIDSNVEKAIIANQNKSREVVLRRMNRSQYQNAMSDLLQYPMDYKIAFPEDRISKDGFTNDGSFQDMSISQMESYLNTARKALKNVLVEGEQPERKTIQLSMETIFKQAGRLNNRLGRHDYWGAYFQNQPANGPFTIRVKARTNRKENQPYPYLRIRYGYQLEQGGIQLTTKDADFLRIDSNEYQVYSYTGHAEFFPSFHEGKFPLEQLKGGIILLNNGIDEHKNGKKKVTKKKYTLDGGEVIEKSVTTYTEDPEFPKIYIESVEFISHDYQSWPPKIHQNIIPPQYNLSLDDSVRAIIANFLFKAWRRQPTTKEINDYVFHYKHFRQLKFSEVAAIREVLAAALSSAKFLYFIEEPKDKNSPQLNAYELATRLSMFLWNTVPDEQLLSKAKSGNILKDEVLKQEYIRMMADPKSERFIEQFTNEWLKLDSVKKINTNLKFKEFRGRLVDKYIAKETQSFFGEILRKDLSALTLIDADFTMVNGPLAGYYGLKGPISHRYEKVKLNGKRPGGLLGHTSILYSGSDGTTPNPIRRAVWIRENLLHDPPKPPPPDVPSIVGKVKNIRKLTIRQRLELHREDAACMDCHRNLDPWGIALENYDTNGMYRTKYRGKEIKSDTVLPDGTMINNIEDLKKYIVTNRKDQFTHALTAKLLTYALGRQLILEDDLELNKLHHTFEKQQYKISHLLQAIVLSPSFRQK